MLWVAFELLESIHLWSPFIVCRDVCGLPCACVLHLRGNWGDSRRAERMLVMYLEARSHLQCHMSFRLLDISQYNSCFCFKFSLSKLQVLYPLPRLAFPAMPCLSGGWSQGTGSSFIGRVSLCLKACTSYFGH